MFVVDLVKDALTPPTQRDNAIMPECDHNTKIFGSWKKKKNLHANQHCYFYRLANNYRNRLKLSHFPSLISNGLTTKMTSMVNKYKQISVTTISI